MNEPTLSWQESGWRWLWITALLIVVDQLTKFWIVSSGRSTASRVRTKFLPTFCRQLGSRRFPKGSISLAFRL